MEFLFLYQQVTQQHFGIEVVEVAYKASKSPVWTIDWTNDFMLSAI